MPDLVPDLAQALATGADAATVAIAAMLLRQHVRLARVETMLHVVCDKLKISAQALKGW